MGYAWLLEGKGERDLLSFEDRLVLDGPSLTGVIRRVDLGNGLEAFCADIRAGTDARLTTSDDRTEEVVGGFVAIDGDCRQELPEQAHPLPLTAATNTLYRPRVRRADYAFRAGSRLRALSYNIDPQRLVAATGGDPPPALAALLPEADRTAEDCRTLASNPAMRRAAREALDQDYSRDLERLYIESRVLELLLLQTEALAEHRGGRTTRRTSDDRVRDAAALLEERLHDPPSLAGLTVLTGLSERELQAGFRARYGRTVFAYLRDARLDAAYRALQAEAVPLRVIAERVGYANPSNFSHAFRRRFGITPGRLGGADHR